MRLNSYDLYCLWFKWLLCSSLWFFVSFKKNIFWMKSIEYRLIKRQRKSDCFRTFFFFFWKETQITASREKKKHDLIDHWLLFASILCFSRISGKVIVRRHSKTIIANHKQNNVNWLPKIHQKKLNKIKFVITQTSKKKHQVLCIIIWK